MFDPVGPLPPAVYWRRRVAALLALLLAGALITWVIARLAFAESGTAGSAAASGSVGSTASASAEGTSADGASGAASAGASDGAAASPAADGAADPAATSDANPPADPTETSAPATTPPVETPAAPPPPAACANEQIVVTIASDPATFAVGTKPDFVLSIQNAGAPCIRDLDAAGQEVRLYDGAGNRVWGSNDCYPEKSNDVQLLATGQVVSYPVRWSGKVSEPTCSQPRPKAGPGVYYLEGFQGGVTGARVELHIQ